MLPGSNPIGMLLLLLQGGVEALVVVLFVINRKRFKEFFKKGLAIGIGAFILGAPFQVLLVLQLDVRKLMEGFTAPGMSNAALTPGMISIVQAAMVAATIVSLIIGIALCMLAFSGGAAEWEKFHPRPYPFLTKSGEKNWKRNLIAALIGVAAAGLSLVLFKVFNVGESDIMKEYFSSPLPVPPAVEFILSLGFIVSAAVTEEIIYRGALLGFLFRLSKNRMVPTLVSIFFTAIVWALMHYPNTNSPAFKIGQVFVLGVILAELSRRWSVESAISLHVTFNVASLVLASLPIV